MEDLEDAVEKARLHKEWEVEHMIWQAFEMDARREGWEEGLAEGLAKGREKGLAEGIINSGRRHMLSDEVIIQDIIAETGCDQLEAEKILKNFSRATV